MARQEIPAQATPKTIQYANLLGLDYQSDPTEISRNRSPEMVNMISDLGGIPVKRCGYRKVGAAYDGTAIVNGECWAVRREAADEEGKYKLRYCKISFEEGSKSITETNAGYYEVPDYTDSTAPASDTFEWGAVNKAFGFNGYLYVMTNGTWIEHDVATGEYSYISIQEGIGFKSTGLLQTRMFPPKESNIPVTYSMYKPDGSGLVTLPSGTDITGLSEGVSLLTPFRAVEYCVTTDTASEKVFNIPNCRYAEIVSVYILSPDTYDWEPVKDSGDGFHYSGIGSSTTMGYLTPDGEAKWARVHYAGLQFSDTPYIKATVNNEPRLRFRDTTIDVPPGAPNVKVIYAPFDTTSEYESLDDSGSTLFNGGIHRGYYNSKRTEMFASGTLEISESRLFGAIGTRTYYSAASNPLKIYDKYYFDVDAPIVTYAKTSSSLAVISEDVGNATVYLAIGDYNETLAMQTYRIKASNATIGAVAGKVNGTLNDEPLFLARTGLYGLSTNYLSEKYSISRSGKINKRLTHEANLADAVGIAHNNYFYLAIDDHMYVLDGRHRETSRSGDNSYECYYFENTPEIKSMFTYNGRMYFSDSEHVYTWSDDLTGKARYLDNAYYDSEYEHWSGTTVKAKWCSAVDGDGAPQYYKTLSKKGTMVTLAPPMQTSCQISLVKDEHDVFYVGRFDGSIFQLSDGVLDAFTKKKLKKYKRLQFIIENNEPEPFGIVSITKTFTLGNFAKR